MSGVELPDNRAADRDQGTLAFVSAHARPILAGAVVLAFFGFCYADVFRTLWIQWNTNEANSHGFLIPWISLYVLWVRRERLAAVRPAPVWWAGLLVLVPSLGVLLVGRLVGVVGLQEVSIVISLWGLVLLLVGWHGFRELWFPVAYLLFMMPIWDLATEPMYHPLQMFAATLGTRILTFVGVPVFQDGTFLHLPNMSLEVAYACSGINFLMSVLAIGILLAYVSLHGVWRRLVIVASAVVVALLANPVRVALIVYTYYTGIATPRQSHMWQGMVVSMTAFAVLFAGSRFLDQGGELARANASAITRNHEREGTTARWGLVALCCGLLALVGLARPLVWTAQPMTGLGLDRMPATIGQWHAVPGPLPPESAYWTLLSDELWREYRTESGESVRLYIGRFAFVRPGMTGVGYWSDRFGSIVPEPVIGAEGRLLPMNRATTLGERPGAHVIYWYQLGEYQTTSRVVAKLFAALSAITGMQTGPIVVVISVADNQESGEAVRAKEFARGVVDALVNLRRR